MTAGVSSNLTPSVQPRAGSVGRNQFGALPRLGKSRMSVEVGAGRPRYQLGVAAEVVDMSIADNLISNKEPACASLKRGFGANSFVAIVTACCSSTDRE